MDFLFLSEESLLKEKLVYACQNFVPDNMSLVNSSTNLARRVSIFRDLIIPPPPQSGV
jgi:hypothetical protein